MKNFNPEFSIGISTAKGKIFAKIFLFFACSFFLLSIPINISAISSADKEATVKPPVSDDEFLEKVGKDTFSFFLNVMDPETGLVRDSSKQGSPCNIAGEGFFLTAICIAQKRGWMGPQEAEALVRKILRTIKYMPHKNGFFYHFVSTKNGQRVWNSELSSIDTALLAAGVLTAGEFYGNDIKETALEIYNRINWQWMLNNTDFMCMGWDPDKGFLYSYWDRYAESMILYALAIGSETYPLDKKFWTRWQRDTKNYGDYSIVFCSSGCLFTYQYSHGWIDFRKINDPETDWWQNSVDASLANRQFCIDNSKQYQGFSENSWGITACLGPQGYKAYGSEPAYYPEYDGTICPAGAGSSIAFTPKESIQALKYMYDSFGPKIYGKNGFKDAYNLDEKWFSDQSLSISQGILLIMIENYRSEFVWNTFMPNKFVQNWINKCALKKEEK